MDRDKLIASVPNGQDFAQLHPAKKLEVVVKLAQDTLVSIAAEQRNPDAWEADQLVYALGNLRIGFFTAALVAVQLALTPPEHRSPQFRPISDELPTVERLMDSFINAKHTALSASEVR